MYKRTLFILCLSVAAASGGAVGTAMVLGALVFVLGALARLIDPLKVLTQ
jgi:hypothetical protein